jgi:hypothetical protein
MAREIRSPTPACGFLRILMRPREEIARETIQAYSLKTSFLRARALYNY